MVYLFDDVQVLDWYEMQYFEMFGNWGIYYKGWIVVIKYKMLWILVGEQIVVFDDDVWEFYDIIKDWSQVKDLVKEMLEKLYELQWLWLIEVMCYNVFLLDDDIVSCINFDLVGRLVFIRGNIQVLFLNMGWLLENCVFNFKNKLYMVIVEVEVFEIGVEGVIVVQGVSIGGWSLYVNDGKFKYCYNLGGIKYFYVEFVDLLLVGVYQVCMEFVYVGGGLGKGGEVIFYVDG